MKERDELLDRLGLREMCLVHYDISEANAPAIYVKGGLLQFLEAVKVEVSAEVPDLTTKKGRDRQNLGCAQCGALCCRPLNGHVAASFPRFAPGRH